MIRGTNRCGLHINSLQLQPTTTWYVWAHFQTTYRALQSSCCIVDVLKNCKTSKAKCVDALCVLLECSSTTCAGAGNFSACKNDALFHAAYSYASSSRGATLSSTQISKGFSTATTIGCKNFFRSDRLVTCICRQCVFPPFLWVATVTSTRSLVIS